MLFLIIYNFLKNIKIPVITKTIKNMIFSKKIMDKNSLVKIIILIYI